MKFIITILLCLPLAIFAQKKNDNTILAHQVEFKQAVNILLDNGYRIDKIDSNYYTIKTEYKTVCPKCVPEVMLDIRVKDTVATIKGKWRSNGGIFGEALTGKKDLMYFDVMNERGNAPQGCFKEMDRIAKLLSPNVTYLKQ